MLFKQILFHCLEEDRLDEVIALVAYSPARQHKKPFNPPEQTRSFSIYLSLAAKVPDLTHGWITHLF